MFTIYGYIFIHTVGQRKISLNWFSGKLCLFIGSSSGHVMRPPSRQICSKTHQISIMYFFSDKKVRQRCERPRPSGYFEAPPMPFDESNGTTCEVGDRVCPV
jgi:hypothetical protein